MGLLANSSFVQGINGWRPVNIPAAVTATVVADSGAPSNHLLRVHTSTAGGSVAYDTNVARAITVTGWDNDNPPNYLSANGAQIDPSVGVIAWVRASPGSSPISATLALWQLPQPNHSTNTTFTVGNQWTMVGLSHDREQGGTTIRVEFYLNNAGPSLDIASVILC